MRLPRLRFTVRRLMLAVAIVAVILGAASGVRRRAERFRMIESYHRRNYHFSFVGNPSLDAEKTAKFIARNNWHNAMTMKYGDAADHPWLPIPPDPPEP